jgi:hypothetical protein
MVTPQTRAAVYPAAGFAEWGGLGWAIRVIDGVKVIEHGGSLSGFQVKLKIVPARRFAIAILTNSGRGAVPGDHIAGWALDHVLGLRASTPELVTLPDAALARFAGRYRYGDNEVATFTVADGGLRLVLTETDPITQREDVYPPILFKPRSDREFVAVTQDENEGVQADFIERDNGSIRFLRLDGRLYDPITEDTPR